MQTEAECSREMSCRIHRRHLSRHYYQSTSENYKNYRNEAQHKLHQPFGPNTFSSSSSSSSSSNSVEILLTLLSTNLFQAKQ